jgi:hypothetical protein
VSSHVAPGCRLVALGRGSHVLVDDDDYEAASRWPWTMNSKGYPEHRRMEGGRRISLLLGRYLTKCPKNLVVCYLNLNPLDCRRQNLLVCKKSQQLLNQLERHNASGFKGVVKHRRRWSARAWDEHGHKVHIGHFVTPEAAARAYDDFVRQRFGIFARYNFPRSGERSAHRA